MEPEPAADPDDAAGRLGQPPSQNMLLEAIVENISIGLCRFDASRRLVASNRRYAEIYGLAPGQVRTGMTLSEIMTLRAAVDAVPNMSLDAYVTLTQSGDSLKGAAPKSVELKNGRVMRIRHHTLPDGGYVSTTEDITEQRVAEALAAYLAQHDTLTGLPNRDRLRDRMKQALDEAATGFPCALVRIDLDHFRSINETLGYALGDGALRCITERLREATHAGDFIARLSGDEFAIVQRHPDQPQAALDLAGRLLRAIARPAHVEGHAVVMGASIGIAVAPRDGQDVDTILRNADLAVAQAKAAGRGRATVYTPSMDTAAQRRRALEADLRKAVASGDLTLAYQPVANLQTGRVTGFEALLRWDRPQFGRISAAEFIPLAEENGLIVPLGEWVLRRACAEAARWPRWVKVAVNVSAAQFRAPGLFEAVVAALEASGLAASRLELEITESAMMQSWEETANALQRLKHLGVRISMDDFGTGYSSLSYLRKFPFDKIKIDQAFVRELTANSDSVAIVRAIVALCGALGMTTTAEGVETQEQFDILMAEGCTEVQGYLLSAPRQASELPALLDRLDGPGGPPARPVRRPAFVPESRQESREVG